MARPAFFKSGYIGKLGDTIGQIQKGKAIVKAYAKPRNPDTPAQRANREKFGQSNRFAMTCLLWQIYNADDGNARAKIQKDCIKNYLDAAPSLASSLLGLKLPPFKVENVTYINFTLSVDENYVDLNLQINRRRTDEDPDPEPFTAQVYLIFYNPDTQKLEYEVSEVYESHYEIFFQGQVIYDDWELEPQISGTQKVAFYAFAVVDGIKQGAYYGISED